MQQVVRLFGRAREVAGALVEISLPPHATVAVLRQQLVRDHPELAAVLAISQIAVNHEFADTSTTIPINAEVAVIPPVSGG